MLFCRHLDSAFDMLGPLVAKTAGRSEVGEVLQLTVYCSTSYDRCFRPGKLIGKLI